MTDQAEVLRVFDANDASCRPYRGWPPLMDWIREHGAEPNRVRRLEVLLLDCPFVRFYEIDVDDRGRPKIKSGTGCEIAMLPPRDVLLRRMPPARQAAA